MARIYMVRHGRASAAYGEGMDPGLAAQGHEQAAAVAQKLRPLGPLTILSSPMRRTQETAAPLAKLWSRPPIIEPAVAEIPSPAGMTLEGRAEWLRGLMAGSWRGATRELAEWREACIASVAGLTADTVIFSHFVAINVVAGGATGDDRVVSFSPEYCSVTTFETDGVILRLVDKGSEAPLTKVN